MNIVDALVGHHNVLRNLYRQSETDPEVFEQFMQHLIVHHTMEEKYFYDLLEQVASARHDALEAVNEHHIIELIIKDADGFPRDHENFPIKIEGLGEYTNHHLDEEEQEIFPMARQLFSEEDLITLGNLFEEAKDKLLDVNLPEVPANIDTSGSASHKGAARGLGIGSLKK
jgi:hemerythrin-like domain-containing protein